MGFAARVDKYARVTFSAPAISTAHWTAIRVFAIVGVP